MTTPPIPVQQGLVVFAKNKKRVSAFYRQTLGLLAVEEKPSHDLLQGPGIEIVIHTIPRKIAADIQITRPPQVREETPLKPTFVVHDLKNLVAQLSLLLTNATPDAVITAELVDNLGRVVRRTALVTGQSELNLDGVPAGLYSVRLPGVEAPLRRLVVE